MVSTIGRTLFGLAIVAGTVLVLGSRATATSARSGALPNPVVDDALAPMKGEVTTVFAGGCFWGVQAVFEHVKGVKSAISGYAGGKVASPSYEEVSSGTTGHAESVRVTYDPSQVKALTSLEEAKWKTDAILNEINKQMEDANKETIRAAYEKIKSGLMERKRS